MLRCPYCAREVDDLTHHIAEGYVDAVMWEIVAMEHVRIQIHQAMRPNDPLPDEWPNYPTGD